MGCSVKGLIIDCLYFMEICNTTDLVKHDVEAEGKGNDEKGVQKMGNSLFADLIKILGFYQISVILEFYSLKFRNHFSKTGG